MNTKLVVTSMPQQRPSSVFKILMRFSLVHFNESVQKRDCLSLEEEACEMLLVQSTTKTIPVK